MTEGRRIPAVVVIADRRRSWCWCSATPRRRGSSHRAADGRAPAATLVPEGVRSAVWYCAFATADRLPHSDDAAILTNLGGASVAVAVSVMANGNVTSSRRVQLAGHATITLQAGDIGAAAGAGVLIEPFGSDVVVDHARPTPRVLCRRHRAQPRPAPIGTSRPARRDVAPSNGSPCSIRSRRQPWSTSRP